MTLPGEQIDSAHDEALARVTDELRAAREEGRTVDYRALAERHEVTLDDVRRCLAALHAIGRETQRESGRRPGSGPHAATLPEQIGPYRLLEEIGEGGMGSVFLAEQTHPVRRRVALKLIKLGMDTKEVVARFESERQALALMDHPNIARVLDAGSTDSGRPFFVMDYVQGVPITEYADSNRLSTDERLDLITQICDAVQHAHQKGIIHRDLKPTNILVSVPSAKPVAKIIDFGVARATNQRLTEHTLYTEQGRIIGTPEYMSPEQAEMSSLEVDTRTDIYSLGVLLYELLVGTLPFDVRSLRTAGLDEIRRKIRHDDPPKPSSRVATLGDESMRVALHRRTVPSTLVQTLRGDLDWITMKAMEKDRTRRYATAAELAADITRYLNEEPVLAGPPRTLYRLRKYGVKYRGVVVLLSVALLALLGGLAFSTSLYLKSAIILNRAEGQRAHLENYFRRAEAAQREIEAERLAIQQAADQLVASQEYEAAAVIYRHVHAVRKDTEGADHPETLEVLATLVDLLGRSGALDEAAERCTELYEARSRTIGEDSEVTWGTLNILASLHRQQGRFDDAERSLRAALARQKEKMGDSHRLVLETMRQIGLIQVEAGHIEDAVATLRDVAKQLEMETGGGSDATLQAKQDLARVLIDREDHASLVEAEMLIRPMFENHKNKWGVDDPRSIASLEAHARVLARLGILVEATEAYSRIYRASLTRRELGPGPLIRASRGLAGIYMEEGAPDDARRRLTEAVELATAHHGPEAAETLLLRSELGEALVAEGYPTRAFSHLDAAIEGLDSILGGAHPDALRARRRLALAQLAAGDDELARETMEDVAKDCANELGLDDPFTLESRLDLARLHRQAGRLDDAAGIAELCVASLAERLGPDHPRTLAGLDLLADILLDQGRFARAESAIRRALGPRERLVGARSQRTLLTKDRLVQALLHQGLPARDEEAEFVGAALLAEARSVEVSDAVRFRIHIDYGVALTRRGKFAEAETLLGEAHRESVDVFGLGHGITRDGIRAMVELYRAWEEKSYLLPGYESLLRFSEPGGRGR